MERRLLWAGSKAIQFGRIRDKTLRSRHMAGALAPSLLRRVYTGTDPARSGRSEKEYRTSGRVEHRRAT